jgi:hypothetical protein
MDELVLAVTFGGVKVPPKSFLRLEFAVMNLIRSLEWRDVSDGPPRVCRPFRCYGTHEIVVPALLCSRDIGVGGMSTDIS